MLLKTVASATKKIHLLLLIAVMAIVSPTIAAAASNTCTTAEVIGALNGTTTDASASDSTMVNRNSSYYWTFKPNVAGTIQVSTRADKSYNSLYIMSGCSTVLWSDTSNSTTKSSPAISVSSGEQVVIRFYRRYNGSDINLQNITFTFKAAAPMTTPPVANDDSATTDRHTDETIDVLANDQDTDGDGAIDPNTIVITSQPSYGTAYVNAGRIVYEPETPFDPANIDQPDTFTYTVKDVNGLTSNAATVTVTVSAGSNEEPVANDKNYETTQGAPVSGNVITGLNAIPPMTADTDADGDALSVSGNSTPLNGAVVVNADGSFTYTPDTGFIGTDSFGYDIEDGYGGSASAVITVTILEAQANLGITKTASGDPVETGQDFYYTLTVTSEAGTAFADTQNIIVTDELPEGVAYRGYEATGWSCNFSSGTFECTRSDMSPGDVETIQLNVSAPGTAGMIVNTVSVTSDITDPTNSNNEASVTTEVVDSLADLSITKFATPNPANTASTLTYTLRVTNDGPSDAETVQVYDNLPNNVNFVSVDGGTDWSCGQGTLILCDYIGNDKVLESGTTATPIVITVTTPPEDAYVVNETDVSSTTYDDNLTNNHAEIGVNVVFDTIISGDRDMTKYLQYNLFGDIKLIGNASLNKRPGDQDRDYNDNVYMTFVDEDSSGSTFNSSFSTLALDPTYEIIWTGLYWEGHICDSSTSGQCVWSNAPYSGYDSAVSHLDTVWLKTPNRSGYISITANNLNKISEGTKDLTYSAFADITSLIAPDETGTYGVANVVANEGQVTGGGNYGGWGMLFIYTDPAHNLHFKNVSVFNGFKQIASDGYPVSIDGFITPLSGPITASIAFFAADGDPVEGGVARMREGLSTSYGYVGGDSANPTDNLLNSSIAEFGTPINSGVTKTYGVDADRVDVSDFMDNGQEDTRFLFDVRTPSGGVDHYTLSMFAFATDLVSPIIDGFQKDAVIEDSQGNRRPSGVGEPINPGEELIYTLTFKNTGDEIAELVEVFDDFDYDGLTPYLNLAYFNASKIKLSFPNSSTWQSNPDCGYDTHDNKVWCRIPEVAAGEEYTMEFAVNVKYNLNLEEDVNVTNTAYSQYKNATIDSYVILVSNAHGDFGGKSNTHNAGTIFAGSGGGFYPFGPFDAWDTFRGLSDRNISTRVVSKPFDLNLSSIGAENLALETKDSIDVRYSLYDINGTNYINGTNGIFEANTTSSIIARFNVPGAYQNVRVAFTMCADYNGTGYMLYPYAECAGTSPCSVAQTDQVCYRDVFSSDNFAIRPKAYDVNITSANNQFFAKRSQDLAFIALSDLGAADGSNTYRNSNALLYNDIESNTTFLVETVLSDDTKTCEHNDSENAPLVAFTDGLYVGAMAFEHVGDFNLSIHEPYNCYDKYAVVDCDDGDVVNYWTVDQNLTIEPKEVQIIVSPASFDITANYQNHGNGFTYLANFDPIENNGSEIASRLDLTVAALRDDGSAAENYTELCYATPISVMVDFNTHGANLANLNEIQFFERNFGGWDDDNNSLRSELNDGNDTFVYRTTKAVFQQGDEGVANLELNINFDRAVNNEVNPFEFEITDLTVTDANGATTEESVNQSAIYLYGRAHAPRYRVDVGANTKPALIYYEYFSDDSTTARADYNLSGDDSRSSDSLQWFINTLHNPGTANGGAGGDGTVYVTSQKAGSGLIHQYSLEDNASVNATTAVYTYDGSSGYPHKGTIRIITDSWLVYDRYNVNAVDNEFEIEFNENLGDSEGLEGSADVDEDDTVNTNTSRRINW